MEEPGSTGRFIGLWVLGTPRDERKLTNAAVFHPFHGPMIEANRPARDFTIQTSYLGAPTNTST